MANISTADQAATVHITLQVGEKTLGVALLGPNFLILNEPAVLARGPGIVTVEVDCQSKVFPVNLPQGASPETTRVRVERVMAGKLVAV